MTSGATCLRCGNFEERWPIADLLLCSACLETRLELRRNFWSMERAPPEVGPSWAGGCAIVSIIPAGFVLGALVGSLFDPSTCTDLEGAMFGFMASVLIAPAVLVVLTLRRETPWRDHCLKKHGVDPAILGERAALGVLTVPPFAPPTFDVGAFVLTERGLAFFGQNGTRLACSFERIASFARQGGAGVIVETPDGVFGISLRQGVGDRSRRATEQELLARLERSREPS